MWQLCPALPPPNSGMLPRGGLAQGRVQTCHKQGQDVGQCPTRCHPSPRPAAVHICPAAHSQGIIPSPSPPQTHPSAPPGLAPRGFGDRHPAPVHTSSHGRVGNWEHWFPRGKRLSLFAGAVVVEKLRDAMKYLYLFHLRCFSVSLHIYLRYM